MSLKLSRLFANLLIVGSLSFGVWGCSSSSDGGGGGSTGSGGASSSSSKAGSGGSSSTSSSAGGSSGGASSSSKASGGSSAVGGSSDMGGSSSGGKTTEGTGTGTGGSSKGGTGTGGTVNGGTTGTGGAAKGGTTGTGGAGTGGTATGGAATGGTGTAKGGTTATGGAGGSATGGTGGSTGTSTGKSSPGCGSASPLKSGNYTEKINNVDRQWILDVPSGYDNNKPTRLIFVWHPLGGTASQVANGYNGLKALSNNSTIFVAPNGLNGSNSEASGNGWWNKDDVDMKFLDAMLTKIKAGLCIDLDRVFTTGFSFGGMMSYTVPWVFEGFRATAPCSGKVGVIDYTSKYDYPIPIMAFHGDRDTFVSTALGKQFLEKFRVRNKCGTETKKVDPSPCVEYQGCTAQTIWCEFPGQHETWSQEPAAIWKFFSQF